MDFNKIARQIMAVGYMRPPHMDEVGPNSPFFDINTAADMASAVLTPAHIVPADFTDFIVTISSGAGGSATLRALGHGSIADRDFEVSIIAAIIARDNKAYLDFSGHGHGILAAWDDELSRE